MAGRVIVFGATGYTGRRTAAALVDRGLRPVLAARDADRLADLARDLGGLETGRADSTDPASVRALVERDDVLVSTVGPFVRRGRPAVDAVMSAGARYLDSSGEPPFLRAVFERAAPRAVRTGATLMPAFGFDYVPGNLAGALALRGTAATRVDVGYFIAGNVLKGASRGTRASVAGMLLESSFTFHGGRITGDPPARGHRFDVAGRAREGLPVGGSEHFTLPRAHPGLREVGVFLGTARGAARVGPLAGAVPLLRRLPGARALTAALSETMAARPDDPAPDRPSLTARVIAVAADERGRTVGTATVRVDDVYGFTARALAWAAQRCVSADAPDFAPGALGPVDAFGIANLTDGCVESGLAVERPPASG